MKERKKERNQEIKKEGRKAGRQASGQTMTLKTHHIDSEQTANFIKYHIRNES